MKKINILLLILMILTLGVIPVLADQNTPVSMDFKGADLRDVFRILAQLADVNLITHQSVQGEITLSLKEVPFKEAIELITLVNDLEYKWIGNTLLIAEPNEIVQNFSDRIIETYNIQYAALDKIKEVMETLLVDSQITVDDRTRTLVISGERNELEQVRGVIAQLDSPIPQVFLEVEVEEISTSGLERLGKNEEGSARLKFLTNDSGLVVDIALELPQFVEFLKQEGLARTLANPGLVTLDGQVSKLLIGDKVPVETEEVVDGKVTTTIKYIEAGIKLEFTPRITADGFVTLNVKPQISSLGEYLTKGYPLIKSREVETVVRIRDGETFVIGGLIREEDRTTLEKVPLLGDIPILGHLFKRNEDSKQATEIIIFITPRIIYPEEQSPVLFGNSKLKQQYEEAMGGDTQTTQSESVINDSMEEQKEENLKTEGMNTSDDFSLSSENSNDSLSEQDGSVDSLVEEATELEVSDLTNSSSSEEGSITDIDEYLPPYGKPLLLP